MKKSKDQRWENGLDELIVSWKDYGIVNSVVLGSENYVHDLEKNIIHLSKDQILDDNGIRIYGNGIIEYGNKVVELKQDEVARINKTIEVYEENLFIKKFL